MRFLVVFLIAIGIVAFSSAQETAHEMDEVIVVNTRNQLTQYTINGNRIHDKLATDVGQLLLLFPGIQLKSYGGIGGLKTANFRAIGAGHTAVVTDFQQASSSQTGATDFSTIPADFVRQLRLVQQASTAVDLPIQCKLAGTMIVIETKHTQPVKKEPTAIGLQMGSFGLVEGTCFTAIQKNKWRFSASWKGRMANGSYPFTYLNGTTLVHEMRKNGDVKDQYGTFFVHYQANNKNTFELQLNENTYRKGLPGAVVFYNSTANQRLNGNLINGFVRHSYFSQKWDMQHSVGFTKNYLQYLDSNYLNQLGYLDNRFHNTQLDLEAQSCRKWTTRFKTLGGIQYRNEALVGDQLIQHPVRKSLTGILGITYQQFGLLSIQFGDQLITDGKTRKNYILPSLDWNFPFSNPHLIGLSIRQSMRQPTFNELYFQQVGNIQLKPESVDMATFRYVFSKKFRAFHWQSTSQFYISQIRNKILATPTKNLFIWSIQNIGLVHGYGGEFAQHVLIHLSKNKLEIHLNYSYQRALDLSSKQSATYKAQLSYTPKHSGTVEFAFATNNWRFFTVGTFQGARYSLNENIPANFLSAFFLVDLGTSYQFQHHDSQCTIRLAINNVTNNYYSYVRYFVMPGIQFNLHLSYAF
jgi:vitamin B12 transporter